MIVQVLNKKYQFPCQMERYGKMVWNLQELLEKLYNVNDHANSLQIMWEILFCMEYMTPRGRDGRSLKMINFDEVSNLINVLLQWDFEIDHLDRTFFPRCECSNAEGMIILDPRGFVFFDGKSTDFRVLED